MSAKVDYKGLGRRIRMYRKMHNLTQAQVAELADISLQYMGNIERGATIPSLRTLISLCYALEVDIGELLIDSMPENGFVEKTPFKLRSSRPLLCNTLSDWLLGESHFSCSENAPVDLANLPPIGFMALDEEFPNLQAR